MREFLKLSTLAVCLLAVTACGFHLRGSGAALPASWQPLSINANPPQHKVIDALSRQMSYAAVNTKGTAKRRVTIEIDDMETRPLYLDAISRTAEVEYSQRATVSVSDPAGQVAHGPLKLEVRRVIANDPDNPIGESSELNLVNQEIAESLARRILEQLSRWADQPGG